MNNTIVKKKKSIVVLVSGNGSNLQAIIDHLKEREEVGAITAVISDKESAYGLERAKNHNIDQLFIDPKRFDSRLQFDQSLAKATRSYQPDLVVLAGFMRILSSEFVDEFAGRLINIHPSLLPKFPGLNTHARAIQNKERQHGSSVHFVTEELDGGPLIAQAKLNLTKDETSKALSQRVQMLEYKLYPWVIELILKGNVKQVRDGVEYNNKELSSPLLLQE